MCATCNPLGLYITALFLDHHMNNPSSLEILYVCKCYHPSNRLKWNPYLKQNTLQFIQTTWLWTHHFDNLIRFGKYTKYTYLPYI